MIFRLLLPAFCFSLATLSMAQEIPAGRTTDWSRAGHQFNLPEPDLFLDIMAFGGIADGSASNNAALSLAFAEAGGHVAVIEFPPGDFLFTQGIIMPDSVVLRGAGSGQTTLTFSLGGTGHCINFFGQELPEQYSLAQDLARGATSVSFSIPFPFQNGDLLRFYRPDEGLVVSPWAIGTTGQLVHVEQTGDATILLASPLRAPYPSTGSYVRKIVPRRNSGVECLKIVRLDETAGQFSNIWMIRSSHCWVRGVESDMTNFAHIEISESTNCEITGNYLHHAFNYGTGGKAYGVNLTNTAGENLIQDNIFEHLRHSMIVQIGANGNVLSYNYSTDPFWQQTSLPSNAAGDLVLHGDHPYLNLFEGNIVRNMVIDDSHGSNGPFNTLFRNRAEGYGLFMSSAPPTDSVNIVGNEITSTAPFQGLFLLNGEGHFLYGNLLQGVVSPEGTGDLATTSLYLEGMPAFLAPVGGLPQVGPNAVLPGTIPATMRFIAGSDLTVCSSEINTSLIVSEKLEQLHAYPSPFMESLTLDGLGSAQGPVDIIMIDAAGRVVRRYRITSAEKTTIDGLGDLRSGVYLIEVKSRSGAEFRSVVVKE